MGTYTLEALLGAGAFGKVYRARMTGPDGFVRKVAIKFLHPNRVDAKELARLRDEARLLGLLHHRAIVQVYELFESSDGWAVVMELVGGVDLSRVVQAGSMPPSAALALVAEVAAALDLAVNQTHEGRRLELVHRDIKPANLRLTEAGEVKVLDFGIAHAAFGREARTETDKVLGTLRYMSPERLQGQTLPAGDIYALGIVLVELLGGRVPKMGLLGVEAHRKGVAKAVRPLRNHGEGLTRLATRMLDATPERRPTAAEVQTECARLARGLPGPSLHDWAAREVPALAEAADATDERVGAHLSSSQVSRRQAPALRWWATAWMFGWTGLLVGGVLAVAAAGLVGAALWASRPVPVAEVDLELTAQDGLPSDLETPTKLADGRWLGVQGARCVRAIGEQVEPLSPPGQTCRRITPGPAGDVFAWLDGDLHHLGPDGSALVLRNAIPLAVDPSGEQLAYLGTDEPTANGIVSRATLRVRRLDGTADSPVLPDTDVRGAIWSPDGTLLVWSESGGWWARVSADGSGERRTQRSEVPWLFAPDGRSVVALRGSEDRPELVQIELDGAGLPTGEPDLLITLDGPAELAASPGGPPVLRVRTRSLAHDQWTLRDGVPVDGRPLRLPPGFDRALPAAGGFVLVDRTTRPGSAAGRSTVEHQLALWDGKTTPRPLHRFVGAAHSLFVTRDGEAVAWHLTESQEIVQIALAPGGAPVELARTRDLDLRDLRIHPRGDLVAVLDRFNRLRIGPLEELEDQTGAIRATDWEPGDWIPGTDTLLVTNEAGMVGRFGPEGPVEPLRLRALYAGALSPRSVVLYREDSVLAHDLKTGAETPLGPFGTEVRVHGDVAVVTSPWEASKLFTVTLRSE